MKVKYTKEMKNNILVGISISTFTLFLYFFLTHFSIVSSTWSKVTGVCLPFFIGFAIAFLLNPIMMFIENKVFSSWKCKGSAKRTISLLITFAIAVGLVAFLLYLIVPSLVESVVDLVKNNDTYIEQYSKYVSSFFRNNNLDTSLVKNIVGTGDQLFSTMSDLLTKIFPSIISTSYGIVANLFKVLIGVVAGLYLLLDKEKFLRHVKKINFAVFPTNVAVYLKRMVGVTKNIFNNFIIGKAIDSLIIGIICYIGLSLLGIRYASLLSVIVGFTNMIPVFGPFIGAVPGIIILLIVEPTQSIYFALFILALQQFDGNILGPLILGDKLGLPSFWILFSVTVGGAFFGILGMFVGVPVFAVLYYGIKEFVNLRLEQKEIYVEREHE